MTTTATTSSNVKRVHQVLMASLFLIALGIGQPATAKADWDIGAYDACLARMGLTPPAEDYSGQCCEESGGTWSIQQVKCTAPPVYEESLPPQPQRPPQPVSPVPPRNIQTLPAPVSPTALVSPSKPKP